MYCFNFNSCSSRQLGFWRRKHNNYVLRRNGGDWKRPVFKGLNECIIFNPRGSVVRVCVFSKLSLLQCANSSNRSVVFSLVHILNHSRRRIILCTYHCSIVRSKKCRFRAVLTAVKGLINRIQIHQEPKFRFWFWKRIGVHRFIFWVLLETDFRFVV